MQAASTSPTADAGTVEATVDAITGAAGQEIAFSMALTQDQKDIRDWVHGFAADVVRPAAHEWDEREETPWPIIEEAAKIGLYGLEGIAQFFADPSGLGLPLVNEELFWGAAVRTRRRFPRRPPAPRRVPARGQGEARRAPRARARRQAQQVAGGHDDLRGLAPHRRRAGPWDRASRLRVRARVLQGARAVR